jgi:hypothetical protein
MADSVHKDDPIFEVCKRARLQSPIAPTEIEHDGSKHDDFTPTEINSEHAHSKHDDLTPTEIDSEHADSDNDEGTLAEIVSDYADSEHDAFTPTEIDSEHADSKHDDFTATRIDSSHGGDPALHDGSPGDSLCGWFKTAVPSPCPSLSSEYDPDNTDNEDPHFNSERLVGQMLTAPTIPHHLQDPEFLDRVVAETASYLQESWFSFAPFDGPFWGNLKSNFDDNVDLIYGRISAGSMVPDGALFKIGITRDPRWRWRTCNMGHYSQYYDSWLT